MSSECFDDFKRERAREYLESVRSAYMKSAQVRSRLEDLREGMRSIRAVDYSSGRSSSIADDRASALAAGIDSADAIAGELELRADEWDALVREATCALLGLDDGMEVSVLMDYYILPQGSWRDVAARLGYSYDGIMKLRSRALLAYYDLMPERERRLPEAL